MITHFIPRAQALNQWGSGRDGQVALGFMGCMTFMGVVIGLALALSTCARAQSQSYPTHAVRLIIPAAAGGAVDSIARVLADTDGFSCSERPLKNKVKPPIPKAPTKAQPRVV